MAARKKSAANVAESVSLAVAAKMPESFIANLRNPRDCGIAFEGFSASRTAVAMRMAAVTPGFPDRMSEKVQDEFKAGYYIARDVSVPAPRWARIEGKYAMLKDGQGAPDGTSVIHLTASFVVGYNKRDYKDAPKFHDAIMALRKRHTTDAADSLRDLVALYKRAKSGVKGKPKGGKAKDIAVKATETLALLIKSATTAFDKRGDVSLPRDPALAILNRALSDIADLAKKK